MNSRKRSVVILILVTMMFPSLLPAQSQAGGIFLLIPPGARAGGMGETHVAVANDLYATYYNPAGLAFQEHHEIAGMHMQWLPGLADDIYYEFLGYKGRFGQLGTVGASFTYLSLGEQIQTGVNSPEELGRFRSYMWNAAISYGRQISDRSAVGVTLKLYRMFLAPRGSADFLETRDGAATSAAVDIAFLTRRLLSDRISVGIGLSNIGPNITFLDPDRADPAPTTLRMGVMLQPLRGDIHTLQLAYDVGKLLASRNAAGDPEPFYNALFGGADQSAPEYLQHNLGAEYWFKHILALRTGVMFQKEDRLDREGGIGIPIPTVGAGIRILGYGFDFGYMITDEQHPLHNTMRFSLNMQF